MKSSLLKINPQNPRFINDESFRNLVKSIEDFPEMMKLRPIVVIPDEDNYLIIGGTMRFRALQSLGYEIIPDEWIKIAEDLTDEQIEEFIIKDNLQSGEWDFDLLNEYFDVGKLADWVLELPEMSIEEDSESETPESSTKEVDTDSFEFEHTCPKCGFGFN
jgi:hypothetical protein